MAAPLADAPARTPIRLTGGGKGLPDVQIKTPSGEWISVHDPQDPRTEARELLDRQLKGEPVPPMVALLGIGLGCIVDELERRRPDVRVVAIELLPGLFDACAPHHRWNP